MLAARRESHRRCRASIAELGSRKPQRRIGGKLGDYIRLGLAVVSPQVKVEGRILRVGRQRRSMGKLGPRTTKRLLYGRTLAPAAWADCFFGDLCLSEPASSSALISSWPSLRATSV